MREKDNTTALPVWPEGKLNLSNGIFLGTKFSIESNGLWRFEEFFSKRYIILSKIVDTINILINTRLSSTKKEIYISDKNRTKPSADLEHIEK